MINSLLRSKALSATMKFEHVNKAYIAYVSCFSLLLFM